MHGYQEVDWPVPREEKFWRGAAKNEQDDTSRGGCENALESFLFTIETLEDGVAVVLALYFL